MENFSIGLTISFGGYNWLVLNCPSYPIENHGDVVGSTWKEQMDYDIEAQGLQWAFDKTPIFEEDYEETGYTLWFPVTEK